MYHPPKLCVVVVQLVAKQLETTPACFKQYMFINFGPIGVRVLPLAASINEGGHYFRYIFLFSCFLFLVTTAIQNHLLTTFTLQSHQPSLPEAAIEAVS
jgi:putative effector of murein hydrolase LrgA (UPF0299 family)